MPCFRKRDGMALRRDVRLRQRLVSLQRCCEAGRPPRVGPGMSVSTRPLPGQSGRRPHARAWASVLPFGERKPAWFKVPGPRRAEVPRADGMMESEGLHTVCQEAACPNIGECWQRGTATFMILGDTCTRRCGFCNVKTGKPTATIRSSPCGWRSR